jgi:hypothetical protein
MMNWPPASSPELDMKRAPLATRFDEATSLFYPLSPLARSG